MSDFLINLGKKIQARREELNLSQHDVANHTGLDQGKICLIERGKRKLFVSDEIFRFAEILKVSITWFFEPEGIITESDPLTKVIKDYAPDISVKHVEHLKHYLTSNIPLLVKHIYKED